MSTLLRPTGSGAFRLTPGDAGWRYIGFEVRDVRQGESFACDLGGREAGIIVLSGVFDVRRSAGGEWTGVGGRANVFEASPHGVYLPAGGRASILAALFQVIHGLHQQPAALFPGVVRSVIRSTSPLTLPTAITSPTAN